jgi:hypothetical protein
MRENVGLVLVYQMRCSVWAIHFLIFVYASVSFTAHVQERAAVAISTQHFFASSGALCIGEIRL